MILDGMKGSPSKPRRWSTFCALPLAISGARFEGAQSRTECVGRWGGFVLSVEVGDEPVAEGGGAERVDVTRFVDGRDAGAGLAVVGAEERGGAGVVEESPCLVGMAEG